MNYPISILESNFLCMPNIDWLLLAHAHEYYKKYFTYQETPFIVPEIYNSLTKPHHEKSYVLDNDMFNLQPQELVGSAEQGFIYLALRNKLIDKNLFSISPCFRSDNYDSTHFPWFMKLELFMLSDSLSDIEQMMLIAKSFFEQSRSGKYDIVQTSDASWDINLNGLEVGSYGLRQLKDISFIYGTGLALPRFTQAGEKI